MRTDPGMQTDVDVNRRKAHKAPNHHVFELDDTAELVTPIPTVLSQRRAGRPDCRPQPLDELAERLYKVLYELFSILGRRDPHGFRADELTLAQLSILVTLRDRGPMRMTALAAHERVRNPTTTVAVRRLERLGFVARSTDPADLRGVLVTITEQGNGICSNALTARHGHLAAMLNSLSRADQALLKDAMPQLALLAGQNSP